MFKIIPYRINPIKNTTTLPLIYKMFLSKYNKTGFFYLRIDRFLFTKYKKKAPSKALGKVLG